VYSGTRVSRARSHEKSGFISYSGGAPDFCRPYKKKPQNAFVWGRTIIAVYGVRPTFVYLHLLEYIVAMGTRVSVLVYLPFLLNFAPFSYHFICFFASSFLQISLFTDLLKGVLSHHPPIRKASSSPSIIFWSNPFIATLPVGLPGGSEYLSVLPCGTFCGTG